MKAIVCGGRDYKDDATLYQVLDAIHAERTLTLVIEGGAKGADWLASKWARHRKISGRTYVARWEKYGRRAGYLRNTQMLEEGEPDLVIAFPGGKGTADMVRQARRAGVPVIFITHQGEITDEQPITDKDLGTQTSYGGSMG